MAVINLLTKRIEVRDRDFTQDSRSRIQNVICGELEKFGLSGLAMFFNANTICIAFEGARRSTKENWTLRQFIEEWISYNV